MKTIAVWGHDGRTTCAVNLAWMLAAAQPDRLICLLSSNLVYGDIQAFFKQSIRADRGLGCTFEQPVQDCLWKAAPEGTGFQIFLLSLANESDAMDLEDFTLDHTEALYSNLLSLNSFDYLIVDGSRDPQNPIGSVGLDQAQQILCLHRPSIASYQWYRSMTTLRVQLGLDAKLTHLLYADDMSVERDQYVNSLHLRAQEELPFVGKARLYEHEGTPICAVESRECRNYRQAMQRVIARIERGD